MDRYRHTQFGMLIVVALVAVIVFGLYLTTVIGFHWIIVGFTVLLAIVLGGFCSLTVSVDHERVVARFGPGPVRKTIRLADIRDARSVRNKWWYGWGIRLTPHGWLYNVSGLDAVEIELSGGKKVRVGTDEPRELAHAIRAAAGLPQRGRRPSSCEPVATPKRSRRTV